MHRHIKTKSEVILINQIYLNDGVGGLTDSGQAIGSSNSRYLDLADLDGDGDLDVYFANTAQPLPHKVDK